MTLFVFAHGLGGFDEIPLPGYPIRYFRDLAPELARAGLRALFTTVSNFQDVEGRARDLARQLDGVAAERIVLVGSSMGGLDARYLACHLDPLRRVKAVITVGTPHRGSPIADATMAGGGLVALLGRTVWGHAIAALTTDACRAFNAQVPDRPDVAYGSYGGVRPVAEIPLLLRPWAEVIQAVAGDNDGLVPLASSVWGTHRGTLRADHFETIGWNLGRTDPATARPFDHLSLYMGLARDLAKDLAG
ncbi:MAG: alpha/beta fold hydrolase [Rhodobacterales bacterium]|nr:alpha/beta fold hydrolase [Rhodobacterales bacterium]